MTFNIKYLDNSLLLSDEYITSLEIENKNYFYRIINGLNDISNGILNDDYMLFNKDNEEINITNYFTIFIDYFNFNLNDKKIINGINKKIKQYINDYDNKKVINKFNEIKRIFERELVNFDFKININNELNIDDIIKLFKLNIVKKDSILDNILLIIDIYKCLSINNILVFVNLKQYLTECEIAELYKYVVYNKLYVILIDSQSYGVSLENEKKLIIDKDLDEFML